MSAKSLNEFYRHALTAVNIEDNGDGLLSLRYPDSEGDIHTKPATVDGKRLVLPIPSILKDSNWDEVMGFHPLCENILRGESDVVKLLKRMVVFRLGSVAAHLMTELMEIAATPERHSQLNARQGKFLKEVPNANSRTSKTLTKVIDRHFDKLITIFLKRDFTLDDEEYRRAAVVSFPIWEELKTEGTKIYDVDCGSKKNKQTIVDLFEFIFPDPENTARWSAGSTSSIAPYFDALFRSLENVGDHLNKLTRRFKSAISLSDLITIELGWYEGLDNLKAWKGKIPPLPGNEGALMKGEAVQDSSQAKASYLSNAEEMADQKVGSGDSTSINQSGNIPVGSPGGNGVPVPQPQQQSGSVGFGSQPVQQPSSVNRTSKGVDVRSVLSQQQTVQHPNSYPQPSATPYGPQHQFNQPMNTGYPTQQTQQQVGGFTGGSPVQPTLGVGHIPRNTFSTTL